MIFAPTNSYTTIPAVTIGPIPNSINVPLLEAMMSLVQSMGSSPTTCYIPYNGILEAIKYIIKASIVHITLSLRGTSFTDYCTSGIKLTAGLK